ncbi:MAG: M1 family aminopeptidase, partial [Vicinamibacterales bacterium]
MRAICRACIVGVLAAAGVLAGPRATLSAAAAQQTPAPAAASAPADSQDDEVTLQLFLRKLEAIVRTSDVDAFVELEGPLGDREDARAFATAELLPGVTKAVVQERERQEVTLSTVPGTAYGLTVDAFIEYGNQARVATWQFFVRRSGDSWGIFRQQLVSSVDDLFRLTMNAVKQYDVTKLEITSEDLLLTLAEGTVFTVETDRGLTGLVLMGKGDMRFSPAPETEKGQVRIFSGSDVLETRFDAAYVRVGTADMHFDMAALNPRATVDKGDLRRAQQIFKEESSKSFAVDLADLTRDAWTLLPGPDDFLAEVRTKRFATLTYAHSASEPEDITVFERKRHKNIAIYPSKAKFETRGRFYNEDDLAPFDVLDYDIEVTALPDREWIDGKTRMRLRARAASLGQLNLRLADSLVVRSIVSDKFGRLFNLRVSNQNTVLINLPKLLQEDEELELTVTYAGRLTPQTPDRETLSLAQDDFGPANRAAFLDDPTMPKAEPSFLYSNRSYWYPQSMVSDYATAKIRLTVPASYVCVASGDPTGEPVLLPGKGPLEGRRVFSFNTDRPARYLSFIVSRFVRVDQSSVPLPQSQPTSTEDAGVAPTNDIKLTVQANPRQTGAGRQLVERASDILRFYESLVGDAPYPGFTIALVENTLPGGHSPPYFAQLNQPLPNSPLVWRNDPAAFENYPEFFMAHEIAHQWWGHGVGWQSYHDQWLSEGFAQYFAALYADRFRGDEVFQGLLRRMRRWAINESDQGPVNLGYRVGHIKGDGRAFRAIVYNKAAMVLHMLRLTLGDDVFFSGVRRFYISSQYHKVGSEDFRVAMEQESGKDLKQFFERWIYSATLPKVAFSFRVDADPQGPVALLRFTQTGDLFDLPVMVTLDYADGS